MQTEKRDIKGIEYVLTQKDLDTLKEIGQKAFGPRGISDRLDQDKRKDFMKFYDGMQGYLGIDEQKRIIDKISRNPGMHDFKSLTHYKNFSQN